MKSGSVKDMERYGKSSIASSAQMETLKADPTTPNKFFSKTVEWLMENNPANVNVIMPYKDLLKIMHNTCDTSSLLANILDNFKRI